MKEFNVTAFVAHLVEKGFPEDRIIFNWNNSRNNFMYDMVIVGSDYISPIAIFEFKVFNDPSSKNKFTQGTERSIQSLKKNVYLQFQFSSYIMMEKNL